MKRISFYFFVLMMVSPILNGQDNVINYTLSTNEPHSHYFEVSINAKTLGSEMLAFKMPVWAPGSYLVREFAKNVNSVEALDERGNPLDFTKTNKNTWEVNTTAAKKVNFSYKVYANELTVRTSFVDSDHGYINGTSVFMYIDGRLEDPIELEINLPDSWSQVSTSLTKTSDNDFRYSAHNYEFFTDCPIEMGNHQVYSFTAAGIPHEIAMYGEGNYEIKRIKEDITKIIESFTAIFDENPNDKYLFIVHNLDNRGGGLEHLNSTTLQVNRWSYAPESSYLRFLGLVAHEYFHLWMVKRLRPAELVTYDYENENYTNLLWVMEGFTSYYDEVILKRTGITDEKAYLKSLSNSIGKYENKPGNKVQSVAASSHDAWIKFYRQNENSYNSEVSYYGKGSLLAALLDMKIIGASNGKYSLDNVVRDLYQEFYKDENTGITDQDLKDAIDRYGGKIADQFFEDYVYGTKSIDYASILEPLGLKIDEFENSKPSLGDFGIYKKTENKKVLARTVVSGSDAFNGGINAGDELIAIDHYRIEASNVEKVFSNVYNNESLIFTISREGKILNLQIPLNRSYSYKYYKITKKIDSNGRQDKFLARWLNDDNNSGTN